jgi:hypothetical protein
MASLGDWEGHCCGNRRRVRAMRFYHATAVTKRTTCFAGLVAQHSTNLVATGAGMY